MIERILNYILPYARKQGVKLDKELVPELAEASHEGKVTMLWNQQVKTDRTAPYNKTDSIMRDNERGTCLLKDIAIWDGIFTKKEAEKILKHREIPCNRNRAHAECKQHVWHH